MTTSQPPGDGATQTINGLEFIRSGGHWLPAAGSWPCQHAAEPKTPEMLVAFLYRCLRDGASVPGEIEEHAIQAAAGGQDPVAYTNPHLEAYARALAGLFLRPKLDEMKTAAENRYDQLQRRQTPRWQSEDGATFDAAVMSKLVLDDIEKGVQRIQEVLNEEPVDDLTTDQAAEVASVAEALSKVVRGDPGCNDRNPVDDWVRAVRGLEGVERRPVNIVVIHRDGCAEGVHSMQARADADYVIEVTIDGNLKLVKDRYGDAELREYR